MSKLLTIWLLVFATSILFTVLDSRALFYLFWSAIAVAYVAWCIWVFRYSRKITYSDKKLHSALDVISKPAAVVVNPEFIVPVLYHRAYAEYLEFVHTCETAHVAVPTFECWKNLSAPFCLLLLRTTHSAADALASCPRRATEKTLLEVL